MSAVEIARVTAMVLLIAALPVIVAAGLLVSPLACVVGVPVWIVAQYLTRPGARLSVWRLY